MSYIKDSVFSIKMSCKIVFHLYQKSLNYTSVCKLLGCLSVPLLIYLAFLNFQTVYITIALLYLLGQPGRCLILLLFDNELIIFDLLALWKLNLVFTDNFLGLLCLNDWYLYIKWRHELLTMLGICNEEHKKPQCICNFFNFFHFGCITIHTYAYFFWIIIILSLSFNLF